MTPDIRQELEAVLMRIANEHGIAIRRLDAKWIFGAWVGKKNTAIGIEDIDAEVVIVSAKEAK